MEPPIYEFITIFVIVKSLGVKIQDFNKTLHIDLALMSVY